MSDHGKLKCLLCGKLFNHLGSHLWHGHEVLAREYKEAHGLPYNMALISDQVYQKKSEAFEQHRKKYLKALTKHGKKYQFPKGHSGERRISEKERTTIIARIKDVNKRKEQRQACPICKTTYNHLESHLYNKHRLISVKKTT